LISLNLLNHSSAILRIAVIGKLSLGHQWKGPQAPFPLASAEIFPGGDNVDILLMLFRLKTMQCKRTFTQRFTHSTQKEIAPFYGNNHKKCTSLAAIARHFEISYTK